MRSYLFFFIFICFFSTSYADSPDKYPFPLVYLTWQQDPTTTMTIHWISKKEKGLSSIQFKEINSKEWKEEIGTHRSFPQKDDLLIHTLEINDLSPNTAYQFYIKGFATVYKFRTAPTLIENEPLSFVVGGDMYHSKLKDFKRMNESAAKLNPLFAVAGGDLAYTGSRFGIFKEKMYRWLEFFEAWQETMVTPEGFLIPIIPLIGNHEVKKRYDQPISYAEGFYALFSTPGTQGYAQLNFGDYMSFVLLDSGHTHSIDGVQKQWLVEALKNMTSYPHKFAMYHVGAYGSSKNYDKKKSPLLREHWSPLFEKFGLDVAFEHHDHIYKRSYPIKNNKIDSSGVIYIGGGSWGTHSRSIKATLSNPLINKAESKQHVIHVVLFSDKRTLSAIDDNGVVFDSITQVND